MSVYEAGNSYRAVGLDNIFRFIVPGFSVFWADVDYRVTIHANGRGHDLSSVNIQNSGIANEQSWGDLAQGGMNELGNFCRQIIVQRLCEY